MPDKNHAQTIAELAQQPLIEANVPAGKLVAYLPPDWQTQDLSHLLPKPQRKAGSVTLHDADSFIAYTKAQGSLSDTRVYIDADYSANKVAITAVLNDHGDDVETADWRDHRAVFAPRLTEEWKRWTGSHGQAMSQAKLAHFLEANINDIASPADSKLPTGADVLTFVTHLSETRKVKYTSGVNTQNGMVQLEYVEEGDGAQKGKLEVFRQFCLGVRPYLNGQGYQLMAFLRYRIDRNNGELSFWYELQRPDRVLQDATADLIAQIKAGTGFPTYFGTP